MSSAAVEVPAKSASVAPKKVAAKKTTVEKKPATKPAHPPTGKMVVSAIAALKERNGSSLHAIKKYIASNYVVNVERQSVYICKFLNSAVEKKSIIRTKGLGASGRFKLAAKVEGDKKKVVKKSLAKKPAAEKKITAKKSAPAKKSIAKKDAVPKKSKTTGAKKPAAKPKAVKVAKSAEAKLPSKAKKNGKTQAVKPKAPKPKKATASKPKAAKK